MSDVSPLQKAMFERISLSLQYPISAFAGGKDAHTILSCCAPTLKSLLSEVAATQIRLAHPVDCPKVFKAPQPHEIPEKYSLQEHNRMTTRGGDYYQALFERAPEQFTSAMHYLWYHRHIPRNMHCMTLSHDTVFINDSTFRSILRDIFCALHKYPVESEQACAAWNSYEAREIHHLVNVMSGATLGINPHSEELWAEAKAEVDLMLKRRAKKQEDMIFLGLGGH